jgi:hypothetical protein
VSTAPRLQFANYLEAQPAFQPTPVHQPQEWVVQPTAKKPPCPVGPFNEVVLGSVPLPKTTRGLDHAYVIEDRPAVTRFIEENRLHGLLLQASQPLKAGFGEDSIRTLSIVSDDEGFETLYCIVITSGDLQQRRQTLRAFDRTWWLSRAKQAAGRLNFDFKLI